MLLGNFLIIENTKINKCFLPSFIFFCILLFTSKYILLVIDVQGFNALIIHDHTISTFYVALFLKLSDLMTKKNPLGRIPIIDSLTPY